MIPKRTKDTDISTEVLRGRAFRDRLFKLADEVARRHASGNESLPTVMAEIAARERFNQTQIQRLVEEGNTRAYLARYEKVRNLDDRRFAFIPAELDTIIIEMGDKAPPKLDNPNWIVPTIQGGSMQKSASTHETEQNVFGKLHRPFDNNDEYRQKLAAKEESERLMKKEAAYKKASREVNSLMHKVASACVQTQRFHKSGGVLFNTVIDQAGIDSDLAEGIAKKASAIQEELKQRGAMYASNMVDFKMEATEKVASHMLGSLSLMAKQASTELVQTPQVASSVHATDYNDLIALAHELKAQAEIAQANKPMEVK